MADVTSGGGSAAPASLHIGRITVARADLLRIGVAIAIFIGITVASASLSAAPGRGVQATFSLLVGTAIGTVFQRGRFCFFCIMRDYIEFKNSAPLMSVLAALAVGSVGYVIVFTLIRPNAAVGLPAGAHIGPVSWALVAAGFAFGVGMALSGACISGHLYRLGEGYSRAPIALLGALLGFGLGFATWNEIYLRTISGAPVVWLPNTLGYGGALLVQLALLTLLAVILWRHLPELTPGDGGRLTAARLYNQVFRQRWNPLVTGALVGVIGVFAYLRVEPLGVTAQLGSVSRTLLSDTGYLPERLIGLDTFAGCVTAVVHTITNNGFLISGLVLGSLAVALLGDHFRLSSLTPLNSLTALIGGVLMGWASMIALGCTVGTLLSGVSALALSGWVFFAATFAGVFVGIRLRLHQL
jgi:uncharacterized protein